MGSYFEKNTKDSVFLLSLADVQRIDYGFEEGEYCCLSRMVEATPYALVNGAVITKNSIFPTCDPEWCARWWLRLPCSEGGGYIVRDEGQPDIWNQLSASYICARPAMWIKK